LWEPPVRESAGCIAAQPGPGAMLYDAVCYAMSYTRRMSTISFRPTDEDRRNMAALGETPTEAIRRALRVAAAAARDQQLRAEAEALAANAEDRAEVAEVREFLGDTWDQIQ
jgi:hypothetical protein